MRFRRRFLATAVVLTVSVAACVGIEHLSSTAQEAVVLVGSNPIGFGTLQVGQISAPINIVIAPASGSGDSNDTVSAIASNCPDFSVNRSPLPATVFRHCFGAGTGTDIGTAAQKRWNAQTNRLENIQATGAQMICSDPDIKTAMFPATFHPSSAGSSACTVTFTGTFAPLTVTLTGTGVLPPHAIDVTPKSIDFGDVRTGTQANFDYDIRNTGAQPLSVTAVSVGGAPFSTTGGPVVIAAGGGATFTASCHPNVIDSGKNDAVTIVSDATNLPTAMLPLACHGIDSPLEHETALSLVARVHESDTKPVTITNKGNVATTVTGLTLTGSPHVALLDGAPPGTGSPPSSFVLNPNQSRVVTLRYQADEEEVVETGVNLAIGHDGTADNVKIQLTGQATAFGTDSSQALDFGPVCAGSTASMAPVKVFASLDGFFNLDAITQPGSPFAWVGATGTALGGHANDLTFMPSVTPTGAGLQTSMVTLTTDIPEDPTHSFTLSVDAKDVGTTAEPQLTDYGPVQVADVTAFKTVKYTNCSGGDLMVTDKRIEGEASGDFKVVGPDPFARVLHQAETMEIQVVMAPQAASVGLRNATLVVVDASGGETSTALTGTAIGDGTAVTGPETYYECSAGGSGSVFVGLAIGGLLIRRRRRR